MATPPVFSAGAVLTASQMNAIGMWHLNTTTFTTQNSVNVDSVFSSDYNHYRVLISASGSSAGATMDMNFRTTTTDIGNVYYRRGFYWINNAVDLSAGPNTYLYINNLTNNTNTRNLVTLDIFNPNIAANTSMMNHSFDLQNVLSIHLGYFVNNTTQYTGFNLNCARSAGSTMTGSVSVYGYRK
jgi:hypothetical protein